MRFVMTGAACAVALLIGGSAAKAADPVKVGVIL
jgi:hypothetical protein